MGCCSGRFQKPLNKEPSQVDKTYFSSLHSNYLSNKQNFYKKNFNVSSNQNKKINEELEELSQAREQVSIEKLSLLLDSTTPITIEKDTNLHTWADNPKTIGTLSVIQIGIFASDKEVYKSDKFTREIIKNKVVEKLINFLKSEERDKFEASVLALSFLTENSEEIVECVLKKNALPLIVKFMADKKEGLKATAALCCRNLYVAKTSVQKSFIREGGGELLVTLLDSDDSVTVFETILNLLDLVLDSEDMVQPDVKKQLVGLGVVQELERIAEEKTRYESDTIKEAEKLLLVFD